MRYFTPDASDPAGTPPATRPDHGGDSSRIPSDMDSDPRADEEVIDQQRGNNRPQPADAPNITPTGLSDSIAYALDGSGPGPANDTPNVPGHEVIKRGTTGAGLDDEEDAMRK